MLRRRTVSGLSVLGLILAVTAGFGVPGSTLGASHLRLCGRVNVFVAPTVLLPGALTVGPTALVVAAGTDVPSQVEVGANLCFDVQLDADGSITDTTVKANTTSSLDICGVINAYAKADETSYGSLRIGGADFVLAAGSHLPAAVQASADLCLDLTLNAFGQVAGAAAHANTHSTVRVCGKVTNFDAATATSTGALTVGPRSFVTGVGSTLPAAVREGANLCTQLAINGLAQVSGGTAQANITSTLEACGQVSAFAAATVTGDGRLTIDSVPRSIAAGTSLSPAVRVGAFVRMRLTLDAFGRISDDAVLATGASLAAVCDASPNSSGAPSPSGSPATPSEGAGGPAGVGSGASASPSSPDGTSSQGSGQGDCSPTGAGGAAAAPVAGDGGLIPDTASLGRAGRVIGLMALPLLMLMLLVIGYLAVQGRRGYTLGKGTVDDRGAEEVAS
jgi:hypothetical protein